MNTQKIKKSIIFIQKHILLSLLLATVLLILSISLISFSAGFFDLRYQNFPWKAFVFDLSLALCSLFSSICFLLVIFSKNLTKTKYLRLTLKIYSWFCFVVSFLCFIDYSANMMLILIAFLIKHSIVAPYYPSIKW
ncbi:hypothetical protein [Neisseria sp. Ec49-e6-T10]|uniref:hypothetical protein n=1 Tax=Neisseria sp. Ec49-e6-T10 TaxID=3140744 RepID=UPI003EC1394B